MGHFASSRGDRKSTIFCTTPRDSLRSRAESLWHDADWDEHRHDLSRKSREASRMAKECVREHPLSTAALDLGVVAVIGYLATRR